MPALGWNNGVNGSICHTAVASASGGAGSTGFFSEQQLQFIKQFSTLNSISMSWYYADGGQRIGPVTDPEAEDPLRLNPERRGEGWLCWRIREFLKPYQPVSGC